MFWMMISWQSIIAGVITALAVSIIMAVLGVALGFTVVKPTSEHPLSGLGTAFGLWSVLSVVAALAAGGFVSGMFAGVGGREHGFMVWATVLLAGTLFSGLAIGVAVRSVGSAARAVGSGAATVASSIGGGVSQLASGAAAMAGDHWQDLKETLHLDYDFHNLGDDAQAVLKDTGIESLQPDFLKGQMQEARKDMREAFGRLRRGEGDYNAVIKDFIDKEKGRLDGITGKVDKNAAVTALMKARNIGREEALEQVDNALLVYDKAVDKAKDSLAMAQEQLEEAKQQVVEMTDRARQRAEEMSSTAARSAFAAAVALVIGAVVCIYAGSWGAERSAERVAALLRDQSGLAMTYSIPDMTVVRERDAAE